MERSSCELLVMDGVEVLSVPLAKGGRTLIDASDFPALAHYTWRASVPKPRGVQYVYAKVTINRKQYNVYLHRLLLGLEYGDKREVDHVNHDGLDNRRKNIRVVDRFGNTANLRSHEGTSSRFKGVAWGKQNKCWVARVHRLKKTIVLGGYPSEEEAAYAYQVGARFLKDPVQLAHWQVPAELVSERPRRREIRRLVKHKVRASRDGEKGILRPVSRFRGVSYQKRLKTNPWAAVVAFDQAVNHVGVFATEIECACAFDAAAEYLGKRRCKAFAKLEPEELPSPERRAEIQAAVIAKVEERRGSLARRRAPAA